MKHIFIHIGKTAGTSFRTFLESNVQKPYWGYGKTYVLTHEDLDVRNPNQFTELEPNGYSVFDHFDLFSEHAPFGLHRYIKNDNHQYIAVLREPISRTISAFRYAIDRGWAKDSDDIIEWFKKDENKDKKHYQLNYISGVPIDGPAEVKINKALLNLEKDSFLFGFTEAYNEFIDLCCETNEWKPEYKTTNVTRAKASVTDEQKESLKEFLKDETEFYNKAIKLYNKKYNKSFKND
tara:strand:- start:137 stop:844 length:708 start_codon:yes stop_codon:yes gene_type:complete